MKYIASLAILFFAANTFAANPIFTNVGFGQKEFNDITKDLTAAFSHTTNSGAGNLGKLFGVEVGLVGGVISAKNLKRVAENVSGQVQDELKYLPAGGLIAGVALPMGFGAELSMIPKVDVSDVAFSNTSLAVRWNITDMFPLVGTFSPLKLTARASYGMAALDYSFSLTGNDTEDTSMDLNTMELGVLAGVNLVFVEPYVGLSLLKSSSDLDATSTVTIPVPGQSPAVLTDGLSLDSDLSTQKIIAGVLFKIPFMRIGVEYANLEGINRYTAKLSLKF